MEYLNNPAMSLKSKDPELFHLFIQKIEDCYQEVYKSLDESTDCQKYLKYLNRDYHGLKKSLNNQLQFLPPSENVSENVFADIPVHSESQILHPNTLDLQSESNQIASNLVNQIREEKAINFHHQESKNNLKSSKEIQDFFETFSKIDQKMTSLCEIIDKNTKPTQVTPMDEKEQKLYIEIFSSIHKSN
jgi:hypothetical protein